MIGNMPSFQAAGSLIPFGVILTGNSSRASGAGGTETGLIDCLPCLTGCGDSALFSQDLDEQGSALFMPAFARQGSSSAFNNGMGMVPGFGGFCPSMMGGQQQMQMLQLMMMLLGMLMDMMMQNGMSGQQETGRPFTGNWCPGNAATGLQGFSNPGSFSSEAGGVSQWGDMTGATGYATQPSNTPYTGKESNFADIIKDASKTYGVDEDLIRAVIRQESSFNPNARSHCGAMGLMQLMPGTAGDLGVTNAYDPRENVMGGTKYLRSLLDRFDGNVPKALAGYNAGPGAVKKYGGVPPFAETQNYVKNITGMYEDYKKTS